MSTYFEHDCDECIHLGTEEMEQYGSPSYQTIPVDLYWCPRGHGTLIARFSSDGPDYSSGTCFYGMNPYITRAGNLALEQGHITKDLLMKETGGREDAVQAMEEQS